METHKNTIVDKVFSHIGAFLLLAAGGFSIWGTIEQQVQTAWGASKEGCIAGAVAAYLLGVASGIMLVRHFELSKATIELSELRDSLTSAEKEVKATQAQLAGKDAAIQREKEKNAKLAAILDERKRQEREQAQRDRELRRALDGLLPRERSCLAMVLDVVYSGHVFSARGELNFATLDALVRAGFVERLNEFGDGRVAYTPRLDARGWLFDHRCELPEYGSGEYTLDGGELNRSLYHPLVEFPGAEPSGRDGEVAG